MSATTNYYLRLNLFVALPAALGLYFLARPIVEVLFLRGKFTSVDAESTAMVLRIYAGLLIAASGVRVLVPAYYAIKNTWLPALAAAVALLAHVLLAPLLMHSWGLEGLVLSSFVSASLNLILLLGCYSKLVGVFDFFVFAKQAWKLALAGLALALAVQIYAPLLSWLGEGRGAQVLALSLTIFSGALSYIVASLGLRLEEVQVFARYIMSQKSGV